MPKPASCSQKLLSEFKIFFYTRHTLFPSEACMNDQVIDIESFHISEENSMLFTFLFLSDI